MVSVIGLFELCSCVGCVVSGCLWVSELRIGSLLLFCVFSMNSVVSGLLSRVKVLKLCIGFVFSDRNVSCSVVLVF